jgi:cytidylate kinase
VPIITISRGTLSGGRAVAECLADALGYPCVGREILLDAARVLGASEERVRKMMEVPPTRWARFTRDRERYVLAVQAALGEHVARGDLVYHGLAGQFLLRGLPGVVRVRLIAPLEMRVQALIGAHHATTRLAAERFIRRVDRERRRWVRAMYDAEVGDPGLYDVTINLSAITLETACRIVAELASQPHYRITDEGRATLAAFAADARRRAAEARG